jgi:sulfonate transport system substrate-binding protein
MRKSKVIVVLGVALVLFLGSGTAWSAQKIKVGYLHTVAVDGQFWIAMEKGFFKQQGLDIEPIRFTSGIPLMQALSGGSVDVAIMGAVISNFPAQGVGKVFLVNDIEYNTAKLFARPETHAQSIQAVRGKKIATVKGTTAHVFLHIALKKNGIDSTKDVNIVSMDMAGAVSAFISGAVDYVATWSPFDVLIREKVPGAILLSSAKDFYPESAIMGGWVATNKNYANDKAMLKKIIRAWIPANDYEINHSKEALELIHRVAYKDIPMSDIEASWNAMKVNTSQQWLPLYKDGTVAKWIGQVQKVFVEIGSVPHVVPPEKFFDPNLYISIAGKK